MYSPTHPPLTHPHTQTYFSIALADSEPPKWLWYLITIPRGSVWKWVFMFLCHQEQSNENGKKNLRGETHKVLVMTAGASSDGADPVGAIRAPSHLRGLTFAVCLLWKSVSARLICDGAELYGSCTDNQGKMVSVLGLIGRDLSMWNSLCLKKKKLGGEPTLKCAQQAINSAWQTHRCVAYNTIQSRLWERNVLRCHNHIWHQSLRGRKLSGIE